MRHPLLLSLVLLAAACRVCVGDELKPEPLSPEALADRALAMIDLVLQNHIDPPTRQEMVLAGVKALFKSPKPGEVIGLSKRISGLSNVQDLRGMLKERIEKAADSFESADEMESALVRGILNVVPGEPHLASAKQFKVDQQLANNRYVGIGIVLNIDKDSGFPRIQDTFGRGPAHRGGAKPGDLITEIDGTNVHKMKLAPVIDMLRGDDGTKITLTLRQPKETETRKITIKRTVVPRETVVGHREVSKEKWDFTVDASARIAYVRIKEFASSTANELRKLEKSLAGEGLRALVLDLRMGIGPGKLQDAALVADALLPGGTIGQVQTTRGSRKYEADEDCLFRDWPMAVLVGEGTFGESEWVAAALQDNKRALLVGQPTVGHAYSVMPVPTPDGGALMLANSIMYRGEGTPFHGPNPFSRRKPAVWDMEGRSVIQEAVGGLKPDVMVELRRPRPEGNPPQTSAAKEEPPATFYNLKEASAYEKAEPKRETGPNRDRDLTLEKAIELLRSTLAESVGG